MTRRDLFWRLAGCGFLAAAGGVTLLHRIVWLTARSGPATGLEVALGLASFLLACLGVLLVINGAGLRDGWKATLDNRERKPSVETHRHAKRVGKDNLAADLALTGGVDGRTMLAATLILRAKQREREEAARSCCRDAAGTIANCRIVSALAAAQSRIRPLGDSLQSLPLDDGQQA